MTTTVGERFPYKGLTQIGMSMVGWVKTMKRKKVELLRKESMALTIKVMKDDPRFSSELNVLA